MRGDMGNMKEFSTNASNFLRLDGALGVLGGTFDPIHNGHVAMAQAAKQAFSLERTILLVASDPPHKRAAASVQDRLHMAALALENEDRLELSSLEANRPGQTYTVESLRALKRLYSEKRLCYIIGSDTLYDLPTWREASAVTRLCEFIVFCRAGAGLASMDRVLAALPELRLHILGLEIPNISSTMIRELAKIGAPLTRLVNEKVESYIRENGLYR